MSPNQAEDEEVKAMVEAFRALPMAEEDTQENSSTDDQSNSSFLRAPEVSVYSKEAAGTLRELKKLVKVVKHSSRVIIGVGHVNREPLDFPDHKAEKILIIGENPALFRCATHGLRVCPICCVVPNIGLTPINTEAVRACETFADGHQNVDTSNARAATNMQLMSLYDLDKAIGYQNVLEVPYVLDDRTLMRFDPENDPELSGTFDPKASVHDLPLKGKMLLNGQTFQCSMCRNLTWLNSAKHRQMLVETAHPSHHTTYNEKWHGNLGLTETGTTRTLVVQIAALPGSNGRGPVAAYFFGTDCESNEATYFEPKEMAESCEHTYDRLNGSAAILMGLGTLLMAMESNILPRWHRLVDSATKSNSMHSRITAKRIRLLIQTSDPWIVDLFTKKIGNDIVIDERPHSQDLRTEAEVAAAMAGAAGPGPSIAPKGKAVKRKADKARQKAKKKWEKESQHKREEDGVAAPEATEVEGEEKNNVYVDKQTGQVVPNSCLISVIEGTLEELRQAGLCHAFHLVPKAGVAGAMGLVKEKRDALVNAVC